ncbi:prepilin peptidase [Micromonospora zhanjiangensis]|uniref:Prepilin peptidase n=1 Tax=Micromonospora zhanjiangensis TaxID=1522057 RepID=A0ABV8KKC9_9ACTN
MPRVTPPAAAGVPLTDWPTAPVPAGTLVALAAAVALGVVLGALAPVVVFRLSVPAGTPPRSGCPRCAHRFRPGPSGWLRVGSRCPACRVRAGPSSGVTCLAGGLSFGVLTAVLPGEPALPAFLAVAAVGVPLAGVDLACLRLPDPLVGGALVLAAGGLAGAAGWSGATGPALRGLLAGLAGAAGHLVLALAPGSRLGFGDVKLAGVLGLLLGWLGWDVLLLGLLLPHLLAGVAAVVLLSTGRSRRDQPLPLGPALLAGALLAVALGR